MSAEALDLNLVVQETPLLKHTITTMIAAKIKAGQNPSWWHFARSQGWASLSKGLSEESRLRFELYWRALYKRGFLTEHLGEKLKDEYGNEHDLVNAIAFATMVWVKRQLSRDNPERYSSFQLQPMAFGIITDEKAVGLTVRVEAWELEAYVKGRLLTVMIDGNKAHTRSEFDRDIVDIADAIKSGQWPGASIVTETGEFHTKPCRDLMTPGIIIGTRDGKTAYERQPNGSLKRVTKKAHEKGV